MTSSETCDISERPSRIVRIAYNQSSIMYGTHRVPPAKVAPTSNANSNDMACTRRLLGLPLFATVTSSIRDAYAVTKGSHQSIATILGYAEDGMRASLDFASPVTGRIAGALETPLKTVDNAVCVGLDYVEEKMPSVKLPPGQIYANVRDCIGNLFSSALETLRLLFGGSKNRIEGTTSETVQQEIRKVSS